MLWNTQCVCLVRGSTCATLKLLCTHLINSYFVFMSGGIAYGAVHWDVEEIAKRSAEVFAIVFKYDYWPICATGCARVRGGV